MSEFTHNFTKTIGVHTMPTNIVYADCIDPGTTHNLIFYSTSEDDHTSVQQFIDYLRQDGYEVDCIISFNERYEVLAFINELKYCITLDYVDEPTILYNTPIKL